MNASPPTEAGVPQIFTVALPWGRDDKFPIGQYVLYSDYLKLKERLAPEPRGSADEPRAVLLDKSLRQYAHDTRIECCAAWSDCIQPPRTLDLAKCDYAKAVEDRLRNAIDELADLSKPSEPAGNAVQQWQPVEAGMPPLNQFVYVYTGKHQRPKARRQYVAKRVQWASRHRWWSIDQDEDFGINNCDVSHWAPTLENPK